MCVRVRARVWPPQSLSVRRGMILRLAAAAAVARARVQALEGAKLSQQVCGALFHHTTSTYARDCDLCLLVVCWRVVMLGWAGAMFCGVCVGMTLATATWGFSATLRYAPPT